MHARERVVLDDELPRAAHRARGLAGHDAVAGDKAELAGDQGCPLGKDVAVGDLAVPAHADNGALVPLRVQGPTVVDPDAHPAQAHAVLGRNRRLVLQRQV